MQGIKIDDHFKYNAQTCVISFNNGSEILLKDLFQYPADPNFDNLGSLEITLAFIDEANQVSSLAKSILKSRLRYKLDENGLIPKMLYTCNPSKNWVYSTFYKPSKAKTLDVKKKFIQSLVTDNPFISKHYIENLKDLTGPSKERLLYGNWEYDDDPAKLIDFDSCNDYFKNDHVKDTGIMYITADIARKGRDTTVIRLWNGLRCLKREELKISLVTESASAIKMIANKYNVAMSNTVVDEDGVGGGVVDILQCEGFVNNSRALNGENYANLKSQASFMAAKLISEKKMFEHCPDEEIRERVIEEFEQVKQDKIDMDGPNRIISKDKVKENIGRSPDEWDSIMMRMYFELEPEQQHIGW